MVFPSGAELPVFKIQLCVYSQAMLSDKPESRAVAPYQTATHLIEDLMTVLLHYCLSCNIEGPKTLQVCVLPVCKDIFFPCLLILKSDLMIKSY